MNLVVSMPGELRLSMFFLLGAIAGLLANVAALRLRLAVWSGESDTKANPTRSLWQWLPCLGWFLAPAYLPDGRLFLWRPMLVELTTGLAFAGLYWWEIDQLALTGLAPLPPGPLADELRLALLPTLAAHLVLGFIMLVASLIDLDERIIPDRITVPGTVIGLLFAAVSPAILLPADISILPGGQLEVGRLHVAAPGAWPAGLEGAPVWSSLAVGVGCFLGWCFALLPRRWSARGGTRQATRRFLLRIVRDPVSAWITGMATAGTLSITVMWFRGGSHWQGLLTALVGMAVGGGLVWAVRMIGAFALGREAMGFGDVTLMAMIGTLLGWQNCLIIFFLAPVTALVFGLLQWLLRRDNEIPYGPFLCLATMLVLVNWQFVWQESRPYFSLGWLVPAVVLTCLVLMTILLSLLQAMRTIVGADAQPVDDR